MNSPDLILPALVGLAVLLSMVVLSRAGSARRRRAAAAAAVAEVGTSPSSLLGRVLVTAGVIVGVQWFVITKHANNTTLLWVVLAVPALITAVTLVRLLTVTVMTPSRRREVSGDERRAQQRPEHAEDDSEHGGTVDSGDVVDAELLNEVEGEYVSRWLEHDRNIRARLGPWRCPRRR